MIAVLIQLISNALTLLARQIRLSTIKLVKNVIITYVINLAHRALEV